MHFATLLSSGGQGAFEEGSTGLASRLFQTVSSEFPLKGRESTAISPLDCLAKLSNILDTGGVPERFGAIPA